MNRIICNLASRRFIAQAYVHVAGWTGGEPAWDSESLSKLEAIFRADDAFTRSEPQEPPAGPSAPEDLDSFTGDERAWIEEAFYGRPGRRDAVKALGVWKARRALEFLVLHSRFVISEAIDALKDAGAEPQEIGALFDGLALKADDPGYILEAAEYFRLSEAVVRLLSLRQAARDPKVITVALVELALVRPVSELVPLRHNRLLRALLNRPFRIPTGDPSIIFDLLTEEASAERIRDFIQAQIQFPKRSSFRHHLRHRLVIYGWAVSRIIAEVAPPEVAPELLRRANAAIARVQIYPDASMTAINASFQRIGDGFLLYGKLPYIFVTLAHEFGHHLHLFEGDYLDLGKEEFFGELATWAFVQWMRSPGLTAEMEAGVRSLYKKWLMKTAQNEGVALDHHRAAGAQIEAIILHAGVLGRQIDWKRLLARAFELDRLSPKPSLSEMGQRLMHEEIAPVQEALLDTRPQKGDRRENNWRVYIPNSIASVLGGPLHDRQLLRPLRKAA